MLAGLPQYQETWEQVGFKLVVLDYAGCADMNVGRLVLVTPEHGRRMQQAI